MLAPRCIVGMFCAVTGQVTLPDRNFLSRAKYRQIRKTQRKSRVHSDILYIALLNTPPKDYQVIRLNIAPVSIVCCSEIDDPNWRWLEGRLLDIATFQFVSCAPRGAIEKRFRPLNLARLRGCYEAVRLAQRSGAHVLVTHGPTLAAWCSIFGVLFSLKTVLFAHSFNFTTLPGPVKTFIFALALRRIKHFVVFSTLEKQLYARQFAIPLDRFEFVHWGVRPPTIAGQPRADAGDYVSAIGGNARDYGTLVVAARALPDIPFIFVVRPTNLKGLTLPPNVKTFVNAPLETSMNVLCYSRFMVLPLINSEVPCGHVTIVAAMHLGRAFIVTASRGVQDYAKEGKNALTVPAGSAAKLIEAIQKLWNNPSLCNELGSNGYDFASRECSEERVSNHFRAWIEMQHFLTGP